MDGYLLVGGALLAGALLPGSPAVVIPAALAVMWLARKEAPRAVLVACAIALGVGGVRARRAIAHHEATRNRADVALPRPERCWGSGKVASSPTRAGGVARWEVDLNAMDCEDGHSWGGRAAIYGGPDDLAQGDLVEVVAQLAPPQRFFNEATGDPTPGDARRGVVRSGGAVSVRVVRRAWGLLAWIDRQRGRVRTRIDECFPAETAPMARALVLGESDLGPADDAAFRASGLSHLLAVSGMHLVLVVASVVAALRALLVRAEPIAARYDAARIAAAFGVPLAWAYAAFAGASGSTLRAAWMMSAALLAQAIGRKTDGPRAFALSIFAIAFFDPLAIFDVSFLLSGAATGGILLLGPPLGAAAAARLPTWCAPLARTGAVTLAASIPCAPILAKFAPTVPLGGLLANLVAVPLGESAALPLCLVHAVLSPWSSAERGAAATASGALVLVRMVARGFSGISALSLPVPPPTNTQLAILCVAAAAWAFWRRRALPWVAVAGAALLLFELKARRAGAPRGELRVTFLDVGQGDGAVVDLPDGSAIVVDGGGLVGSPIDTGARALAPALRFARRRDLAFVVLSHPHPDHFGGLVSGLDGARVGALWDTGQGEREGMGAGYAALLAGAKVRGIPLLRPSSFCGEHAIGDAHIQVLAPCPGTHVDRGPNDNSIVLRATYGNRAILFVGDAEREEEADLMGLDPRLLRADVLKVGHHGSQTSTGRALLAAVAPRVAVISVGARNRFGHPHPNTLQALDDAGVEVWRTDRDGAVTVTTDGQSLETHGFRPRARDAGHLARLSGKSSP